MNMDNMVANRDNKIQGYNNLDVLLLSKEVSSYKNNVDKKVPKQAIKPNKLFFNPKKSRVQL